MYFSLDFTILIKQNFSWVTIVVSLYNVTIPI